MIEWINYALAKTVDSLNLGNPGGFIPLFFATVLADIGFPLPFVLDTILFAACFRAGALSAQVMLITLILFLGRQAGSALLYFLTAHFGETFIDRLMRRFLLFLERFEKYLPWVRSTPDQLKAQLKGRINRHASLAVAMAKLTPGLWQLTSVAAGAIRLPYRHFILGIALHSIIYDGVTIAVGIFAGRKLQHLSTDSYVWLIIIGFIIIILLGWALLFLLIRRQPHWKATPP